MTHTSVNGKTLNNGQTVKFAENGQPVRGSRMTGTVVIAGPHKSLVDFPASPASGASTDREWYENTQLFV